MFFITNAINGYRKAFCFRGVADRKSYFFFSLFQLLAFVLADLYSQYICFELSEPRDFFSILIVVSSYPFLADLTFTARRLHDIGLSGWWVTLIFCMTFIFAVFIILWALITSWEASLRKENSFLPDYIWGEYISSKWQFQWGLYIFNFVFNFLLALPKSKTENNKYRPANSVSIPATDEIVS
ncbi:DUF805 domain-containing protein [Buttiauxella sp. 3AFRM03]|uniref:DUF805 domain-containing protein n=1 Tax=Buttiauxella sp. 3AFRM03 TaxID=2479367 RepID=UPI0026A01204